MINIIKYDKENRVELSYNSVLHTLTFYKYGVKKVIEIMIAPMQMSLRNNDFINYKETKESGETIELSVSNGYAKFCEIGKKKGTEQTVNLKKDSLLTNKYFFGKDKEASMLKVENYNGKKNLLFNIGGKINNYIKILKDGRK